MAFVLLANFPLITIYFNLFITNKNPVVFAVFSSVLLCFLFAFL